MSSLPDKTNQQHAKSAQPCGATVQSLSDRDWAELRHNLQNHLTAMRSGCDLVERFLNESEPARVRYFLEEMRKELKKTAQLVEWMKSKKAPD